MCNTTIPIQIFFFLMWENCFGGMEGQEVVGDTFRCKENVRELVSGLGELRAKTHKEREARGNSIQSYT